jgi:hypothetical protein
MDSAPTPRPRLAALLLALAALGAACSGAAADDSNEAADPHAGHGGGAVEPLRPVAGDPVELGPDDDLYAVPDPLPAGEHGTLLQYQEVVPSPLPSARTFRILYLGQTLTGGPTAISGTVFVPTAAAPDDGRTVIGLAHATTGLADECAPSRTMGAELPLMGAYTDAGHVVVATDYEGMGTPGRHPYLVGPSAGRSVLDAVRAAQQLPGAEASDHVGLAGYSQGGHGALWADRLAAGWTPELHIVGTFAGAPATELQLIIERPEDVPFDGFVPMLVSGLAASSRYIDPATYLTEAGVAALDLVESRCLDDIETAFASIDVADLVRPEGPADTAWSAAAAGNNPGLEAADDPVLIVHSETDDTIPVDLSDLVRERLCAAGQDVERRLLTDGSDHVIGAVGAYTQALDWLDARFAGTPVEASSC